MPYVNPVIKLEPNLERRRNYTRNAIYVLSDAGAILTLVICSLANDKVRLPPVTARNNSQSVQGCLKA